MPFDDYPYAMEISPTGSLVSREERDDGDNESAVRALNEALTIQALSLKELQEDPLMEATLDNVTDETSAARSGAPSDECEENNSSFMMTRGMNISTINDAASAMEVSAMTGMSNTSTLAMEMSAAFDTNMPLRQTDSLDNLARLRSSGVARSVCSGKSGLSSAEETAAVVAGVTDIHNKSKSRRRSKIVEMYDADGDDIQSELEDLKASEELLTKELERAENASSFRSISNNVLEAAAQVLVPDNPPTTREIRAAAKGIDLRSSKSNHSGLARLAMMKNSPPALDFIDQAMESVTTAVAVAALAAANAWQANGTSDEYSSSESEESTTVTPSTPREERQSKKIDQGENDSVDTSDILAQHATTLLSWFSFKQPSVTQSKGENQQSDATKKCQMPCHIEFKTRENGEGSNVDQTKTRGNRKLFWGLKQLKRKTQGENPAMESYFSPAHIEVALQEGKEQSHEKHWCGVPRTYWIVVVLLLVSVVLLSILLGVLAGSGSNTMNSSSGQVQAGPSNISFLPNHTQEAILTSSFSPQYKAYQWLIQDPEFEQYSNERRLQRFALATLFYATSGPDWMFANRILAYDSDECQWFYSRGHSRRLNSPPVCAMKGGIIESIRLDNNNLKGILPAEIFLLSNLVELSLADNQLTSTIPTQGIERLIHLKFLNLGNTSILGPLPSALGSLESLEVLDLSDNQLSGTLPLTFANLVNLTDLHLQKNDLTGSLPGALVANMTNLKQLYLFRNKLSGSIPPEIGNLSSLEDLLLYRNQLNSSIPTTIGDLSYLQRLWLDRNSLTGTIPRELGFLQELQRLNLFQNQLSGTISSALGRATSLEQIRLEGNNLSGAVPARLCLAVLADGDNEVTRILSLDCSKVECDCDCTCP